MTETRCGVALSCDLHTSPIYALLLNRLNESDGDWGEPSWPKSMLCWVQVEMDGGTISVKPICATRDVMPAPTPIITPIITPIASMYKYCALVRCAKCHLQPGCGIVVSAGVSAWPGTCMPLLATPFWLVAAADACLGPIVVLQCDSSNHGSYRQVSRLILSRNTIQGIKGCIISLTRAAGICDVFVCRGY